MAGASRISEAIPADEVRDHLRELMGDEVFRSSQQLSRFLTYVVEQTLEGNGDRLKAYAVGTEALGRDPEFDPDKDPIVRVEAVRLRKALKAIYLARGDRMKLRIELKPGSYRPVFVRPARDVAAPTPENVALAESDTGRQLANLRHEIRFMGWIEFILAVAVIAILIELTITLFHHVKNPV